MRNPGSTPSRPKLSVERVVTALLLIAPAAHAGDPARGRALLADRQASQCVLCHAVPGTPAHLQGDLAPDLRGVGTRLTPDEIRLRLVDPARSNPDTIMPSYARRDGFTNPGRAFHDRPHPLRRRHR